MRTIITAGVELQDVSFTSSEDDIQLGDNLVCARLGVSYFNGTLDANNHNITASTFYFGSNRYYKPTIVMGSGTWEATGSGEVWYVDENDGGIVTFTSETSTIKLTDVSSADKKFSQYTDGVLSGGHTYNNIWLTGVGTGSFIIAGSNTFNDFKVDTPPHTVKFVEGTITVVTTWDVSGSNGNLITLNYYDYISYGKVLLSHLTDGGSGYSVDEIIGLDGGDGMAVFVVTSVDGGVITGYERLGDFYGEGYSVGSYNTITYGGAGSGAVIYVDNTDSDNFFLSKSSGIVECDYLDISNSNATGGAKWYAGANSVDNGNNSGWMFKRRKYQLPAKK